MATKYHFNKDTGRTGKCEAKIKCRLGLAESEHFETREEAQSAFEKSQDSPIAKTLSKNSKTPAEKNVVQLQGVEVDLSGMRKEDQQALQEKWNNRYKVLNDVENGLAETPKYVVPEDLLVESVGEIRSRGTYIQSVSELHKESPYAGLDDIKSDYVVVVSARQGGGNRECYCEYDGHEDGCLALNNEIISEHPNYVTDYDDDFDSTYNYFVFDNKITKDQVEEFEKSQSAYNEFNHLNNERKLVEEGKAPAWFINDVSQYNSAQRDYLTAKRKHRDAVNMIKENQEKNDLANKLVQQIRSGEDQIELDDLKKFSTFRNSYSSYDLEKLRGNLKSKKEAESFQKMYNEAEELEDGSELKNYLLGDRGTRSYDAKEKRGRRNVTVRRTYERGSLLGSELKTKKDNAEWADTQIEKFLEPISDFSDAYKKNFDEVSELRKAKEDSRQKAWESGWVYDSPVPKMPKSFLASDD